MLLIDISECSDFCPRHKGTTGGGTLTTIDLHTHTRKMHIGAAREEARDAERAQWVGRPLDGRCRWSGAYHRVGLAPMVAVVRLPTSGGSAACLVPLFFHVDGTSTQWLLGDSLPKNRRLAIQYLFEVFWLLEHEFPMVRRFLFRDFRLLSAFSRQDAAASPFINSMTFAGHSSHILCPRVGASP